MGFADFFQNVGRGLADPELSDGQGRLNLGKLGYNFSPEGSAMLKQRADLAKQHGIQDMATSKSATDLIPFQNEAAKTDFQHQAEVHKGAIAAIHDIATHYGGEGQGGFRQFQAQLEGQDAKTQGELAGADLNREQSAGLAQNRQATGKDIQQAQSSGGYGTVPYINQENDKTDKTQQRRLTAAGHMAQIMNVPGASMRGAKELGAILGNEQVSTPEKRIQQGPDPALAKQHLADLTGQVKSQGMGEQEPSIQPGDRLPLSSIQDNIMSNAGSNFGDNLSKWLADYIGKIVNQPKPTPKVAPKAAGKPVKKNGYLPYFSNPRY